MLRMKTIGAAAALLLAMTSSAAVAQSEQGAPPSISAQRLSADIQILSADAYQGRLPGTAGEVKTLDWLRTQYETLGLQPGGPDGQWLQRIELKRFTPVDGAQSASWTDATGETLALVHGQDLVLRAASNDGQADISEAEMVFAGFGIIAPERGWDDYGQIDVRGKVVVVLGGEPDGEAFNGPYQTHYASASYKADEAFRRGAVGVVAAVPFGTGQPQWQSLMQSASARRTLAPGAADLEFTAIISGDVARAWAAAAGVDPRVMATVGGGQFKAMPLTGLTLSVGTQESIDTLVTHNLIARLPGTDRPNETVIYSAHWDHVGVDPAHAVEGDAIFNGAWDNASGTAAIVELARTFAQGPRPGRSIVFAHMTAEEMGLLGAYAYTADPIYPLETTVADINIDMLPLSGPTRDLPIFGLGQNELEDRLQALAAPLGRQVTDDGQPEQNFFYRSDHLPFARAGVPTLMPWHGVDWVEGGREAGVPASRAMYAARYHQPSDEWSADWDLRSAVENLQLLHRLGLELANGRDWPEWKAASEFGQVRARSSRARR